MRFRGLLLVGAMLSLILVGYTLDAQDDALSTPIFVWSVEANPQEENAQSATYIRWARVDAPDDVMSVEVTPFNASALAPTGTYLALEGEDFVNVLDLRDGTLTAWQIDRTAFDASPINGVLVGAQKPDNGSLVWSPDGQLLTYSASYFPMQEQMPADEGMAVYAYDVTTGDTINIPALTASLPMAREIYAESWSPDGEWLIVSGLFSETTFTTAQPATWAVARDGTQAVQLYEARVCDAYWSPNGRYIASSNGCLVGGTGASFGVTVLFFPENPLTEPAPAPLTFGFVNEGWQYQYRDPVWVSDTEFVLQRNVTPVSTDRTLRETYERADFVRVDVDALTQTIVTEGDQPQQALRTWIHMNDHLVAHFRQAIGIYNPRTGTYRNPQTATDICPMDDGVRLSTDGEWVALLFACHFYDTPDSYRVLVLPTDLRSDASFSIEWTADEAVYPIGFAG